MGIWNISFWDNDEGVDFLQYLFQHLGLVPFPKQRMHVVYTIGITENATSNKLPIKPTMVRNMPVEVEEIRGIFASITVETLARAKTADPQFKKKLLQDKDVFELRFHERIGLLPEHLWTLVHMHVGAPVDDVAELDSLADAFDRDWRIDPWLGNCTGSTDEQLDDLSRKHAPILSRGVRLYKQWMMEEKELKPMKLTFLGTDNSLSLWVNGFLPHSLDDGKLWNLVDIEGAHIRITPVPDPLIDTTKCAHCRSTEQDDLQRCPCGFAFYCSTDCQVRRYYEYCYFCCCVFCTVHVSHPISLILLEDGLEEEPQAPTRLAHEGSRNVFGRIQGRAILARKVSSARIGDCSIGGMAGYIKSIGGKARSTAARGGSFNVSVSIVRERA